MRVVFRSLLAVSLAAWVASCALNDHGLGSIDASTGRVSFDGGTGNTQGAAGATGPVTGQAMGAAGTPDTTGTAGTGGNAGNAGSAVEPTGAAGADVPAGGSSGGETAAAGTSGGAGDTATGAAGDATTGDGGDAATGAGGATATGDAGSGGAAGTSLGAGGTTALPDPGCADGTREGYIDMKKYPRIAGCSGAWSEPGLDSDASHTPECDRRGGNDGDKPDGHGCSIADLCASGWSVCETASAVAMRATSCNDAFAPFGGTAAFFVTRQRAQGLVCTADDQSQDGTNNIYGCGNVGSMADKSCTPLNHMLRDSDCKNQAPWSCADGPQVGNSQDEYLTVTKGGPLRGGALCCKD
jgi:hypothetical protein